MKNLSCFGCHDHDNSQCIKCKDTDCEHISNLKMECNEKCKEDATKCELWNTEHCILHQ